MKSYSRHFDRRFTLYDACIKPPVPQAVIKQDGFGKRLAPQAIIVSFWAGQAYQQHADKLIESIKAFGHNQLSYMVLTAERQSTWEETCALKPCAILHAMSIVSNQCPVLWLDADARLLGIPELDHGDADLAACRPNPGITWLLVNSTLLSGTLWFNNTYNAIVTLERWRDRCLINRKQYDQEALSELLTSPICSQLNVGEIDPRDVCIPDLMPDVKPNARVVHLQASRDDVCRYG